MTACCTASDANCIPGSPRCSPRCIRRRPSASRSCSPHHLTESGQSEGAASFWLKAGKQAAKSGANLEAIGHLRRGLSVVQANARMQGADEMELELRIALGNALIAAMGYARRRRSRRTTSAALELGQQLDDDEKAFAATRGLWVCHFIRADLTRAHDLSVELLKFAKRERLNERTKPAQQSRLSDRGAPLDRDDHALSRPLRAPAASSAPLHQPLQSRPAFRPDGASRHRSRCGLAVLSRLPLVVPRPARRGAPAQVSRRSRTRRRSAIPSRSPSRSCSAPISASTCAMSRARATHANRAMIIATEHNFLHWKQQAAILRGWALTQLGEADEGLSQMRFGLDEYEAMDLWLAGCWFRCLLAEAYAKVGMRDAALRALDGALATARRTGDHSYLAEVYRLQGEITLSGGDPASMQEAEDLFGLSLDTARKQGALSWSCETAVSLARLSRDTGKREHASLLLAPIVGKFSEGFYTPDLKQAMQLINEIGADTPVRQRADPVK